MEKYRFNLIRNKTPALQRPFALSNVEGLRRSARHFRPSLSKAAVTGPAFSEKHRCLPFALSLSKGCVAVRRIP
jgi:hypothetical protein